jgi:hypothetical protein
MKKFWRKPEQRYDIIISRGFGKIRIENVTAKEAAGYLSIIPTVLHGKSYTTTVVEKFDG